MKDLVILTNIVTGVANIADQLALTHGLIIFVPKDAKELTIKHMEL